MKKIIGWYLRLSLPNYDVFDGERHFESGNEPCLFAIDGVRFGVNICEDVWLKPRPH